MKAPSLFSRIVLAAATSTLLTLVPHVANAAIPQVAPTVFGAQSGSASVKAGQIFVVALPSNPTTGYSWSTPHIDKPGVATFVGTAYQEPVQARPGAGGTQLLVFKAGGPGLATMIVNYTRPWEKNAKPARTATLKITVSGV